MEIEGFDSSLFEKRPEQEDDIKRLLFNDKGQIRDLSDVYLTVTGSKIYKCLDSAGHHLRRVHDYGQKKYVDDDPLTMSIMRITDCAYYIGVAACIQLEFGLHLAEVYNLEYEYAINIRSYLECVARVHKGIKLLQTFGRNKDVTALEKGARRLVAEHEPESTAEELLKIFQSYKKSSDLDLKGHFDRLIESQTEANQKIRGYGITTLVDSLKDKILAIKNKYGELSEYLHGDFSKHYWTRRFTYLTGLKIQQSPSILKYKSLLDELRVVLTEDLEYVQQVTMVFKNRMDSEQPNGRGETRSDQDMETE